MQYRDFPVGMTVLLVGSLLFFAANGIVLLVSVVAIVNLLAEKSVHPSFWTLAGAVLGAGLTLFVTKHMEVITARRTLDAAVSLHAEIADRATRC
jgi:hypothetical protein